MHCENARLARARYELAAGQSVKLLLNELEHNCFVAVYDTNCLGDCDRSLTTEYEGVVCLGQQSTDSFVIPAFVKYPAFVPSKHATDMRALLERIGTCEPSHLPEWVSSIRKKTVSAKALSKAWHLPQNHIRKAMRDLCSAGIVLESSGDIFTFSPHVIQLGLHIIGQAEIIS